MRVKMELPGAQNRQVTYLRISVTDRCNLRCFYCHPRGGIELKPQSSILTFEELSRVARVAAKLGVTRFRITGGEPLLRHGIIELFRLLAETKNGSHIGMTTNGMLLGPMAGDLKSSGLDSVNISLDTLDPGKFRTITGEDGLDSVLEAISASKESGLEVKVNVVLLKGMNDAEILDFVSLAERFDVEVRFIELMPFGRNGGPDGFVPVSIAKRLIEENHGLLPDEEEPSSGPAKRFRLGDCGGRVGFIAPVTEGFCDRCNRLRLTCDGRLRPCLAVDSFVDLKSVLRNSSEDAEIERLLSLAGSMRPPGTFTEKARALVGREMREVGG